MSYKIDLHMHSTYSDGELTPVQLVKMYSEKEYDEIALTDHDGIDGVKEAQTAGEALNIQVIPGIEFSTSMENGEELHLLGYYFDINNKALNDRLKKIREDRDTRNQKLLKVFQDMGYDLTYEDLLQRPDQTYVGKPNFALAFKKKGYVEKALDAFEPGKFIESPEALAVKKVKVTPQEAIALIKGAGGIAVLAHPMKIKNIGEKGSPEFYENLEQLIRTLKKEGLGGLECFHPSADHEQEMKLVDLAGKYHLHMTEGSDYHGPEF